MVKKYILIITLFCTQITLVAQQWDPELYAKRKQETDSLFDAGQYPKALQLAEQQISWLQKNNKPDSVYQYMYTVGRSIWKTKSAVTGQQRAEDIFKYVQANDKDTVHHLSALTDLSWFYYESGNDSLCLKTDELYLRTCEQYSKVTSEQIANGHYNLCFDYVAIGKSKIALGHCEQALDALLKDPQAKATTIMKCYNAMGTILYRNGDFKKAKESYSSCLTKAQQHYDAYESNSNMANCYGNLSLIAEDEGNYILAKQNLEKCMAHRQLALKAADKPDLKQQEEDNLIKTYANLATICLAIGEFGRCEKLLLLSKEAKEKLLDEGDPRRNLVYEQLANLYLATGDYTRAKASIEIYKQSCIKHYGYESFWTGFALVREGQILVETKEYSSALDLYNQAIKLFEKTENEDEGKELAGCYRKRAKLNQTIKNYAAAVSDIEKAIQIYQTSRESHDPLIGRCYLMLAEIKMSNGDLAGARTAVNEALVRLEKFQNNNKLNSGRLSLYAPHLPDAYHVRARITDAEPHTKENTLSSFEDTYLAIQLLKDSKNALDADESQLMHYDSNEAIFNFAQDLSHRLYEETGEAQYVEKLLQLGEENKSVMLRRRLNSFSSIAFGNVPDSILQQEMELQSALSDEELLKDSLGKILENEKQYDVLIERIKAEQPAYYELKYNSSVANIQQIQQELLHDGSNLLEYMVTENSIYALIVSRENNHIVKLDRAGIAGSIEQYNHAITSNDISEIENISYQLYTLLFAPVEQYFKGTELYIVPDNELFNLNFETLRKTANGGVDAYLINDYTISYLLSATTALQFARLDKRKASGVLAVAPGFSDELKQDYTSKKTSATNFDDNFMTRIQQPFAVRTAQNIATLFHGEAFTAQSATEENFRLKASDYGVIHFGTHTEINNASPLMSRLILSASANDSTDENDGYLHAYEIYNLQLRAELAVLTACETGSGKQSNSEGILSLAHSFAYAGCPSVVMSVWQIDEKTSARIVEDFYQNLSEGMPKNEALRQAKLKYLKENPGELSAPYYWAGMVLLGDVKALESASGFNYWWLVGGGVFVLSGVYFVRRRKASQG
jgi:CHAT domain-containing protein